MSRSFAIILILATPLLLSADDEDVAKEIKTLQGTWKAVGLEAGGRAFPKEAVPEFLYIVSAGGKATGKMGQVEYQAQMLVDPTKSPKTIDNVHETGDQKGKKQFGIYKVEDGKWIVCMTIPGAAETDRPKSFETKGTACVVFTFELVKDEKKP